MLICRPRNCIQRAHRVSRFMPRAVAAAPKAAIPCRPDSNPISIPVASRPSCVAHLLLRAAWPHCHAEMQLLLPLPLPLSLSLLLSQPLSLPCPCPAYVCACLHFIYSSILPFSFSNDQFSHTNLHNAPLAACRSLSRAFAYEMLSIFFKRLLGPQVATVAVLNHDLSTILATTATAATRKIL